MQLQPPEDSEKAKRIGGQKKIKTRLKHKKRSEIFWWVVYRIALIEILFIIYFAFCISMNDGLNRFIYDISGVDFKSLLGWSHHIINFIKNILLESLESIK